MFRNVFLPLSSSSRDEMRNCRHYSFDSDAVLTSVRTECFEGTGRKCALRLIARKRTLTSVDLLRNFARSFDVWTKQPVVLAVCILVQVVY